MRRSSNGCGGLVASENMSSRPWDSRVKKSTVQECRCGSRVVVVVVAIAALLLK